MAISLRVAIGVSTALIVLVVAATSVAITTITSTEAVRDVGERLAASVADVVTLEVKHFMAETQTHMLSLQNMSDIDGFSLPQDRRGYNTPGTEDWGQPFMYVLRSMVFQANYDYSSVSIIFSDGSIVAALEHSRAPGWVTEGVQTWRNFSNGTGYPTLFQATYHTVTKRPWVDAEQGGPPPRVVWPVSMVTGNYWATEQAFGGYEACVMTPPRLDTNTFTATAVTARYISYAMCLAHNRSGYPVAQLNAGRYLDRMPDFLRGTSKTENTQLFLGDSLGLLMAATTPESPIEIFLPEEKNHSLHSNCDTSAWTPLGGPERIGCRARVADYPYEPLREAVAADPEFAQAARVVRNGVLAGERYFYISQRVPMRFPGYSINLMLFMPESDVLGGVTQGRDIAIGVTVAVAVLGVVAAFVLVTVALAPIDEIARRMYLTSKLTSARRTAEPPTLGNSMATKDGKSDGGATYADEEEDDNSSDAPELASSSMAEVRALQHAYTTMDTAIKSFTKYVPKEVVRELMATNQMCEISMRPMRCSMLFTDIAGFTSICERVPPPLLSALVRSYFERMSRIVMGHGGLIDKFIGDCIMAVWGAPVEIDHHELRAAVCARMLTHETGLDPLRSDFEKAGEALAIRVGVATGEVLAGNMGSKARMSYTVIGDDVNLAARLEALNKQWGTSVMISEETADECESMLLLRYVCAIAVVGKSEAVKVFEVLGVNPDADTTTVGGASSVGASSAKQSQALKQRDTDDAEIAERYGVRIADSDGAANTVRTVGSLLRRSLRKLLVPADEVVFAKAYGDAIKQYEAGNFGVCVQNLRDLGLRADVPSGCVGRASVRRVLEAAERMQQQHNGIVPVGWTGAFTATEK